MKRMLFGILILAIFGIIIFIPKKNKEVLGQNYYYLTKEEALDLGYPGGPIIYKSPQKNYFKEVLIKGNLTDVVYNDDFILAIQNTDTLYQKKDSNSLSSMGKNIYYIIQKKSDIFSGSLSFEQYQNYRVKVGVPKELILEK